MAIIGIIDILFAPLCIFLRNPPAQEEKVVSHKLENQRLSSSTHKKFPGLVRQVEGQVYYIYLQLLKKREMFPDLHPTSNICFTATL